MGFGHDTTFSLEVMLLRRVKVVGPPCTTNDRKGVITKHDTKNYIWKHVTEQLQIIASCRYPAKILIVVIVLCTSLAPRGQYPYGNKFSFLPYRTRLQVNVVMFRLRIKLKVHDSGFIHFAESCHSDLSMIIYITFFCGGTR